MRDPNSSETLLGMGKKDAKVENILRDIERGQHDYIETDTARRVRGADGSVYQRSARSEAAEQIADLYANRFAAHQNIVTIAQAQQWLSYNRLTRVSKSGDIQKNLDRLVRKKAYWQLSVFDGIRVAAQLERPIREKDYNPKISPKANTKTGGTFRSQQPSKTKGSGIMAADTTLCPAATTNVSRR